MSETKFFSIEEFDGGAFVSPLESVRSFSDEMVRGEWEQVLSLLDAANAKQIAIDLGQLSFFGSTMLEWIVLVGKYVKDANGHVVLCNGSAMTIEVLEIARFDTLFPIVETREEAREKLKSLSP
jgi:anti-anti-sigma factor